MTIKKSIFKYILIGILIITGFALASELQSFYLSKFGGLNSSVNVRLLQDFEAYDISNFSLDEIGSIKERDLFGQYNSSSGTLGSNFITGLFKFYSSTSKYFIACAGSNVAIGSGGTFTSITPSANSVTSGKYWSGVAFNNVFYMFNPSVPMQYYQGSGGLNSPASTPGTNCSYSASHKARVWAARSDSLPYRLYWSSLNNGNDWATTGGYADLPDINQEITGIVSWGGYLYVFTETNIYILLGSTPNDFSLRKTNSMVGAIAPRSIKITDVGIGFLARSGVYVFDGNNSNKISTKIESTISGMSKTLIQNACAIYDGRKYWLAYTISGGSYNNRIIIYDILLKDWTIYQGDACNVSYFERAYGGTDKGELYGGSSTNNGIVYQLQASGGTESISHSTSNDFSNAVTENTIVSNTPSVQLTQGDDTYTKFLCHFNGIDAGTAYTTEDYRARVVTFNGAGQLDTAQAKFGISSFLGNGVNAYTTVPESIDWYLGTNPFTVDFWLRFSNTAADSGLIQQFQDVNNIWAIWFNSAVPRLEVFSYATGYNIRLGVNWSPTQDTWYHIAVVRVSDANASSGWKVFINGVSQTVNLISGAWNGDFPDINGALEVGREGAGAAFLTGWMDEPRLTKGITRWTTDFTVPNAPYEDAAMGGTFTSNNIQINANGASLLGAISWISTEPTNTKTTFQTRTGVTNDSVFFNGWQYWSSANSVTLSTVTDATAIFKSSTNDGSFNVKKPYPAIRRNALYYEDEDAVSVNCVSINTAGAVSKNKYIEAFIPTTNLSSYDWLAGWYKSSQTGNTVEFYIGEGVSSGNYVTFNTVTDRTVDGWQKWYWYIGGITSTDRDTVNYIKYRYMGDSVGFVTFGEVSAYNFYTTGDIMSSTPNDWIEYRAILGSKSAVTTPQISSVLLVYTPTLLVSESSLSSYYYTKWFDFKTPQINKQFDSLIMEVNASTASTVTGSSALCTIYCDYDIDFGTKTGTLSFLPTTTANTVRLLKNFPSSTYGKSMRLKIYNDNKDAQVTIKGAEVRYRQEPVTPD